MWGRRLAKFYDMAEINSPEWEGGIETALAQGDTESLARYLDLENRLRNWSP